MTARRFMMSAGGNKSWQYLGNRFGTSATTISLPVTAQAGDLALLLYVHTGGNRVLPSGWSWLYSGSTVPRHCYKVCAGGETSVAMPNDTSGGIGSMMMFRPSGGSAYLNSSVYVDPPASTSVTAAPTPSLIVGTCATAVAATFAKTVPSGYSTNSEYTAGPALHQGYRFAEAGSSASYLIDASAGTDRQVLACFGIS